MPGFSARIHPLRALLRRLGGATPDMFDVADAVEILTGPEREPRAPVIALPGQFEKATAASPLAGSLSTEMDMLQSPVVQHAPVVRYTFHNCLLREGGVEAPRGRFRVGGPMGFGPVMGAVQHVDTGHFCMTGVSRSYFGHWLQDACSTALLAPAGETVFLDRLEGTTHGPAYLDALALAPEPFPVCHVQTLHLYQDFGQGSSKRARYTEMRRRLAAAFPSERDGAEKLYVRRGVSGQSRLIAHEDALIDRLSQDGFEVLDITEADLATIQQKCRHAQIVVSMEGSHLNHLQLAMPKGGCIIAIMPGDRISALQAGYAQATGLRFGMVMADPGADGYSVDISALLDTLDLAEKPDPAA